MAAASENPSDVAALKKYLRSNALHDTAYATYVEYLGKNSTEADHTAFLEYLESEYVTNECHRLSDTEARKIGVFSLLDGMAVVPKGRPPSLNSVLEAQAYQDGNTATYDYYLGERRTREEEQEFRQRLVFVRDLFDAPVNEDRAQAVAEYMLGPVQEVDNGDDDDDDDEGSSASSSASSSSSSSDEEEYDRHRSSSSKYPKKSSRYSSEEEEAEGGRNRYSRQDPRPDPRKAAPQRKQHSSAAAAAAPSSSSSSSKRSGTRRH